MDKYLYQTSENINNHFFVVLWNDAEVLLLTNDTLAKNMD